MPIFGLKIRAQIVTYLLLLFLALPNVLGLCCATDFPSLGARTIYFFGILTFYGIGLCIFKLQRFFYVYALFLLANAIDTVHIIINGSTTSYLFFFTTLKSERGEFLELLGTYWIVVVLFLMVWGAYLYYNHKFVPNQYIFSPVPRKILLILCGTYWLVCGIGLLFAPRYPQVFSPRAENFQTSAWVGAKKVCPINIAHHSLVAFRDRVRRHTFDRQLEHFSFGITSQPPDSTLVVFVIGESTRYDHWGLNGYARNTSPRLSQRNIISFDSCYTIGNLTLICVPYMLSLATPQHFAPYHTTKSLLEAFQEAGYATAWIADQSYNNAYLLRIAAHADYRYYVHTKNLTDADLLPPLETFLHDSVYSTRNQFVVMHSLGCHFNYTARYPDSFQYFCPDLRENVAKSMLFLQQDSVDNTLLNNLRAVFVNSYDNAVRFTDYILDQTITQLDQTGKSAILVYVSDHGENLFDDKRNMFFHGTFNGSQYEYHVPLFVWTSQAFQQRHPAAMEALQHNRHKLVSTMNLFHSLLQGVECTYIDTTKSIFSDALVPDSVSYGLDANRNLISLPH